MYDGITGLVTQPLDGVKKGSKSGGAWGGVLGGIKGFGKGIGGVICKPAAGMSPTLWVSDQPPSF